MESGIDEDGSASIPGGIPGSRRGSKLLDFLEMKKRKPPKRAYKDKQGKEMTRKEISIVNQIQSNFFQVLCGAEWFMIPTITYLLHDHPR